MIKVYLCEDCTREIPFTEEALELCRCGAQEDSWVLTERPEPRCGGEAN
jgi:hypothetical protein